MKKIIGFEKSLNPKKKYDAYIQDDDIIKKISFGDSRYEQFHDKIGKWSHLDHNNENRRRLYKLRHEKDRHIKFTPGWLSDTFLW